MKRVFQFISNFFKAKEVDRQQNLTNKKEEFTKDKQFIQKSKYEVESVIKTIKKDKSASF